MSQNPRFDGRRTRALGIVLLAALGAGLFVWFRPASAPALDCPPEQVHLRADGVAHCGPGAELPAGQRLTLGLKLDLNRVSAEDLAVLPGVGPTLAKAIIDARKARGGFKSIEELDSVPGVGPARLETLRQAVEIR